LKKSTPEQDSALEDAEIVRRILAGEEELYEVLARRYQARVLSHVARMIGNRDDAADLSQEILVKVFQALDRYNPEYKFSTWLFRIAGNAAIDHLRKRRPRTVPLEPEPRGDGRPSSMERGDAIRRAIDGLPAEFKELIALRHFTGLSYEEIAEVKAMPLGTVKNKLFRARAVLKERLAGELT
jgi:RNA polymerase sigma-70 factor (ECF subfamily)